MKVRSLLGSRGKIALVFLAMVLAIGMLTYCPAKEHGNANPGILPINSNPHGMSYGEWAGAWWRWAFSIPADRNPVSDTTGEFAAEGQSGSVWFLAGDFGGTVERTVTVPPGKSLFFPIANIVWVNIPEFGDPPWSEEQEAWARQWCKEAIDNGEGFACEIDGRPVQNLAAYRCGTPEGREYMMDFPEGNVWGIPAGTYGPSVDDGIYLMLPPLPSGKHTIHILNGILDDGSPWLDVTYHITVAH